MSDKQIVLIGGGGHCRSCIDVIESDGRFSIRGIIDQRAKELGPSIMGYPVLGDDRILEQIVGQCRHALVTVGNVGSSSVRQRIFNELKKIGFNIPVIISSFAHVSRHASVEEGTVVMHQAIVNAGARVGKNCILNTGSLIEHDVSIGSHTHISTMAAVNGGAVVGRGSFVGSNATIVQEAALSEKFFFKAGSLVTGDRDGRPIMER